MSFIFSMYRLTIAMLLSLIATATYASTPAATDIWAQQRAKAAAMRRDAETERHQAESIRLRDDAACQHQFFVNACLEKSRDRYLTRINSARVKEIEASSIERDAKTGEMIERDKQRAAHPPRPLVPLLVPAPRPGQIPSEPMPSGSMPSESKSSESIPSPDSTSTPVAVPSASNTKSFVPQPTAKPITPAQQALQEQKKQQDREHAAQKAAERAKKASADKARYEARAKAVAAKKAKHAESAPQAAASKPAVKAAEF